MGRRRPSVGVAGTTNSSVEVLLAEDVASLGKQGDIVRVKPGYARNFLLPQGVATVATEHNKRMVERHRQRMEELEQDRVKSLRKLADDISKYSVTLEANANPEGQLYGSIVAADISKSLKNANFQVEPEHIKLEGPLKELGMYTIAIQLHEKAKAEVKVWVVPAATQS
ncbi:MAG: 50S ribosomal protein L9 [Planctomycetaceae bacterium]